MPITNNGYTARRYSDIVSSINQDLVNNISADLKTTPDTVIGVITAIFSNALAEQEELVQAVFDNFSVDKAEGKFLEDLVTIIGLDRLGPAPTSGPLRVTAEEGTVIPQGAEFVDVNNNTLLATQDYLVTQENTVEVIAHAVDVEGAAIGAKYTLIVEGRELTYTKNENETNQDALDTLIQSINVVGGVMAYQSSDNLVIVPGSQGSTISVIFGSMFDVLSVKADIYIENSVDGPIQIQAGDVTGAPASVPGITSVRNLYDLNTGRLSESDEELRRRQQESFGLAGNGTLPAISAKLRQVAGVTSVKILENPDPEPDPATGLPANSYECVVVGGTDVDIANTIYDSKPAGIQTVGNRTINVDFEGQLYKVNFSRPEAAYFWVNVEYTIYNEEEFPSSGQEAIRQAILDYVAGLDSGDDFIPKRMYGPIYSAVPGIEDLFIEVARSPDPATEPSSGSFSQSAWDISSKQYVDLSADRISVADVGSLIIT